MKSLSRTLGLASCAFILVGMAHVHAADPDQVKQFRETLKCAGCDLTDANLVGTAANGADLRGANLTGANFQHAQLRGASLDGASLSGANLRGADLREASGANLAGAVTTKDTICPSGAYGPC